VRWGYLPSLTSQPVLRMRSGQTVTVDAISHEGILEDQGRDPVGYFGGHGVSAAGVLTDAIAVARDYARSIRNFDVDGPHVVTGPIYVEGAQPGDVLKVEMLSMLPRVPYGVVSSRHGKGGRPQAVSATPALRSSSSSFSAGVFQPSVSRGRPLRLSATWSKSTW
jgi:acetamidase/formamidase